jgi:hypothetical protein
MQITPNEIHSIQDAGALDGAPVKMIRTKGGFWIAIGKPRGKFREEAIAAGSHPAIVKYNLEKQFPGFQPAMMKSEEFSDTAVVEKHSHFLSEDLRKSGHDIYSIQDGDCVSFHITQRNMKIASVNGLMEKNFLILRELDIPPEFSRGMAGASVEKAISCNVGLRLKK